ncbi:MAG: hypothetical protein EOO06_19705 [Chitinophagaceae bacterium]|nr:MAG: hypothetical protein EOO06_19705 [Chitinophagaceae bacterium]
MKKLFQPLFGSSTQRYTYNLPVEVVMKAIGKMLSRTPGWFQEPDINGIMTGSASFRLEVNMPSLIHGMTYHSTLYGTVSEQDGLALVETITIPSFGFKVVFFLNLLVGTILTINGFKEGAFNSFAGGLAWLLIGSLIIIRIADVNNGVPEDRYWRYLHKAILAEAARPSKNQPGHSDAANPGTNKSEI